MQTWKSQKAVHHKDPTVYEEAGLFKREKGPAVENEAPSTKKVQQNIEGPKFEDDFLRQQMKYQLTKKEPAANRPAARKAN